METKYYTVKEVNEAKAERFIQHKIKTSDIFKKKFMDLVLFGRCAPLTKEEVTQCLKN